VFGLTLPLESLTYAAYITRSYRRSVGLLNHILLNCKKPILSLICVVHGRGLSFPVWIKF